MPEPRYIRTAAVAVIADCSPRHIERQVARGLLTVTRVGRHNLFSEGDVATWLQNCKVG